MKKILKITSCLILLVFANYGYATQVSCPSIEEARQVKLIFASNSFSEWEILGDSFTASDGVSWSSVIVVKSNLINPMDVLTAARNKMQTEAFFPPMLKYSPYNDSTECMYVNYRQDFVIGLVHRP